MRAITFSPEARDEIFRLTRDIVLEENGSLLGQCLSFAWHGYQIIKSWPNAPRVILQAGSASWPRIPKELNDGIVSTHFSYVYDSQAPSTRIFWYRLLQELDKPDPNLDAISFPEIHVWLAIPETQELIDFTTGTWPESCREMIKLSWLASPPPEYLWTCGTHLPSDVRYRPDIDAISLILKILAVQGHTYP